ncbi:hypothetical protein NIES39_D05190 [Arthrospira platensis NIES-39]|nr:hypothetical protein NIES39_D05190 [Arthrospira platensis NIES-39]
MVKQSRLGNLSNFNKCRQYRRVNLQLLTACADNSMAGAIINNHKIYSLDYP